MAKHFFIAIVVFVLLWMLPGYALSQDKKSELKQEKARIEEEISYTNSLLEETKQSKKASLDQLSIIRNKISYREKLIHNIADEIEMVDDRIAMNNEIIKDLSRDLENLKSEYAMMIYHGYKNRDAYSRLMFIFSASDFNQAYRRLKYFGQYSEYRKNQVGLIEQTRVELDTAIAGLEKYKAEKLELLTVKEAEKLNLTQEKTLHDQTVNKLSNKEKELMAVLKEKETAAAKLQKEIQKIIEEEIRLAAEKTGTTKAGVFSLTPEEKILSDNFELNRGGLPWPVDRGLIAAKFGEHPHAVLKNVKTKNNGINILASANTKARAVFAGVVTRVMSIPNYNYVVMVRHGEYLTVYSNLDEVYVEKDDPITIKKEIGRIYTNVKDMKTELHFELWKGKTLLDPEKWLAGGAQ
ncbi:MAG: peptidoglycan DD-metalloendopeptidase family protein [Bacteroidales bacterium]|nr:peptidoglycan DD-metalloendopeptidase family protein [Bacteroidales bacterium]